MIDRRSWISIVLVLIVSLAACGGGGGIDLAQVQPGDEIILSENVRLTGLPYAAIPYGATPALSLSNLELEKAGDSLQGQMAYTHEGEGDFTLVVYCSTPEQLLVNYLDGEKNLTLNLPSGQVLFGTQGYQRLGGATGTIEFAFPYRQSGMYSLSGSRATISVLAVPGIVNPRSILPGDQVDPATFQSNSNVLQVEMDF